ncbi:MAG: DUF721 domain-containing protein [Deltaproteobacteria bacterium]|nr:DUF721 domain-containing protein [Deltaproteobacteria bacterium]
MARPLKPARDSVGPTHIKGLARKLFRENDKTAHLVLQSLKNGWPGIVGEELARKTEPSKLEKKVLWISSLDASWAYNLQFMAPDILDSIRTFLGTKEVASLKFKTGPLPGTAPQTNPDNSPGQPSAAARRGSFEPDPVVARQAQVIQDPPLREAFIRAFTKMKARKTKQPPPSH